ncbi:hypothetical protein CSUI_007563, partial [Cystoisospora suis]
MPSGGAGAIGPSSSSVLSSSFPNNSHLYSSYPSPTPSYSNPEMLSLLGADRGFPSHPLSSSSLYASTGAGCGYLYVSSGSSMNSHTGSYQQQGGQAGGGTAGGYLGG